MNEFRIVDLGCFPDIYLNKQFHPIPRYAVLNKNSVNFIEESDDLEDLCKRYNINPEDVIRYRFKSLY